MPTTSAARTKLQDATDWAPLTCKLWSVCEPCSELQTLDSGALRPGAKSLTQKHRPDIQSHDNSSSRWAFFCVHCEVRSSSETGPNRAYNSAPHNRSPARNRTRCGARLRGLMTQKEVLDFKPATRLEQIGYKRCK